MRALRIEKAFFFNSQQVIVAIVCNEAIMFDEFELSRGVGYIEAAVLQSSDSAD